MQCWEHLLERRAPLEVHVYGSRSPSSLLPAIDPWIYTNNAVFAVELTQKQLRALRKEARAAFVNLLEWIVAEWVNLVVARKAHTQCS